MTNNYFSIYDLPTALQEVCRDIWANNRDYCEVCARVAKFMVDNEVVALNEICGCSKSLCKITVEKDIDIYNRKVYFKLTIHFLPTKSEFVAYI